MKTQALIAASLLLLLTAPPEVEAGKWKHPPPPGEEVEATVLSLRRYELGAYLEVLRDDGQQEWIEIGREEGFEIRPEQRVAYSAGSGSHASSRFGRVKSAENFRILTQQRDGRIFTGEAPDGSIIFTDTPSTPMEFNGAATTGSSQGKDKNPKKKKTNRGEEEEISVVDQEELLRKEEMEEEYYRYLERSKAGKHIRRAKRAVPCQ